MLEKYFLKHSNNIDNTWNAVVIIGVISYFLRILTFTILNSFSKCGHQFKTTQKPLYHLFSLNMKLTLNIATTGKIVISLPNRNNCNWLCDGNKPYLNSWYWTGTSLQCSRRGISLKRDLCHLKLKRLLLAYSWRAWNLNWPIESQELPLVLRAQPSYARRALAKLVPVHYREYENGAFSWHKCSSCNLIQSNKKILESYQDIARVLWNSSFLNQSQ